MKRQQRTGPSRRVRRSPVKTGRRARDPHYERERSKYDEPLPSREYILQVLNEQGVPVPEDELAELLEVKPEERTAFQRRLAAMERDGEIIRNRRNAICVVSKLDLIRGVVQGHPEGYGVLVREEAGPDLFLSFNEMQKVLHGDRAMARISGVDRRGRPEGKIVEVLERAQRRVVGRLRSEHGVLLLVPENKRITRDFLIPAAETAGATPGQVVTVEISVQPDTDVQPGRRDGGRAARPGGDGRDHRATGQARAARRPRRGSARQLRRSGHGNRDRAAQARPAARLFARGRAPVRALSPACDRCGS